MKRKIGLLIIALLMISTMSFVFTPATFATPTVITETYVSDTGDLCWSGATGDNIVEGYIVPPEEAVWSFAVECWVHPNWNTMLNPADLKAKLFEEPSAAWIWKAYQVTEGESYTGDIVFFKKLIDIPENAFNIEADLFIITADNAYYFYVNDGWSGTPDGIANFATGYDATNFYYVSDGETNLGGGTNSVPYETVGNLYPLDVAVPTDVTYWSSIESWDISGLLERGENWLQIVAINEHAPPQGVTNNPAGLIYKVEVTYELVEGTIEKTVEPDSGGLGDVLTVTLDVEVSHTVPVLVEDVLPSFLTYIPGTFMVNGVSVVPTVVDGVISTTVEGEFAYEIAFDMIIDSVEATVDTGENWAYLYYDTVLLDDACTLVTTYPYCGFHKIAMLESTEDGDDIIEVGEEVVWEFRITVTNLFDWTMTDVVVTDRLGAELEIDEPPSPIFITSDTTAVWSRKGNVKLTWTIGDLEPGETATLILQVSTREKNGQQAYTSCGDYEFNSGATLKFKNPEGIQLSAHTGPMEFHVPGEWPHFQPYCVRYPETGNVYIGYEDWRDGDFDYNDFGMTFSMEEIYDENWNLVKVTMTFTAVIYDSGMDHLIHIARPIVGGSVYIVTRSVPAYPVELTLWDGTKGKETPEGTYTGTGDVTVVLFNTAKYPQPSKQINEVVTIEIIVVDPSANPKGIGPYPYREYSWGTDYDISIMTSYDPWEEGTLYECRFHIWDTQVPTSSTTDQRLIGVELPFILVVPKTDWIPPAESTPITTPYPEFYDYYTTGSPTDWYEYYSGTGRSWEP